MSVCLKYRKIKPRASVSREASNPLIRHVLGVLHRMVS